MRLMLRRATLSTMTTMTVQTTTFPRVVLWLSAAAWAGFGVMLFLWPGRLDGMGIDIDNPTARAEVRAVYGGLELAIAAFLVWSTRAPERLPSGLLLAALAIGGMGAGRIGGMAFEGFETLPIHWGFLALELGSCAITLLAFRRLDSADASS